MRTTIDIDRTLLERAKRALGVDTYREAVARSLKESVDRAELRGVLDRIRRTDVTWDLDELLAYRRWDRGDPS